ncbi:50S ribosomal protein L10 [Bradyrhizobium sp. CW7]|nr:50S ribosomal protein L10 [Bradyrhizobium sp. CW7]MCK1351537.1 50S ribosomal protein L10 [Bradyrhizobium sp. CW7]
MAAAYALRKVEHDDLPRRLVGEHRAPARRTEKVDKVASLNTEFLSSKSVIVAHNIGLTVRELQELRKNAKAVQTKIKVAKNTLAQIAATGTDAEPIRNLLKGPTVLAYSQDPIAASKAVVDFANGHDKFVILGGTVENLLLDAEGVKAVAALRSLDDTRAKIVHLLSTPSARIVRSLRAPPSHLARLAGILASRPDLASGSKKADIDGTPPSGGTGTRANALPLTDGQALPSKIVKSLESKEVSERLEGIKEASLFLQSHQEGDGMRRGNALSPVEVLQGNSLPERLYERLFSADENEARLAAYALVSNSANFSGGLNPKSSPTDLSQEQQVEFATGFRKLLAAVGQPHFPTVEVLAEPAKPGVPCRLHVKVTLSRIAPFSIGGRALVLDEAPIRDKRMRIESPLAETISATDTTLAQGDPEGLVAIGETDMTIRREDLERLKFPVIVHFNNSTDTVALDVGEFKALDKPSDHGNGAATMPEPKSEGS